MARTPSTRSRWSRRAAFAAAGVAVALVAGALPGHGVADAAPVRAAAVGDECADIMPLADVQKGMTGTGLTVVRGTTPVSFDIEVLGIAEDAIAPGADVIMVEATGGAANPVVAAGGGIWAGMSGSPIYVDGKLLGAAAWGFTYAPSPIFGVTPAEDMAKVLQYRSSTARAAGTRAAAKQSTPAELTTAARRVVRAAGETAPQGSLRQLPLPLTASGVGAKSLSTLQHRMKVRGADVLAVAGAGAAAPGGAAPVGRPVPGGNFGAVVSYGDVSLTGIGTTTYVCQDRALAFGHPLLQAGTSSFGATDADAVAVLRDDVAGSFKLANPTTTFGTVDQDRFSAIAADLTRTPATGTVVRAAVRSTEGPSGTSASEVVFDQYTDTVAFYTAYYLYNRIADRTGPGQAVTSWTVRGTRAGGRAFTVTQVNRYASTYDPGSEAADQLAYLSYALINNDYEPVSLTSIDFNAVARPDYERLRITGTSVSRNGGAYKKVSSIRVRAGDTLRLKTIMTPYRSTATKTSVATFTVPASAAGRSGSLVARGGEYYGYYGPSGSSLDAMIAAANKAHRNDELLTTLSLTSGSKPDITKTSKVLRGATVGGAKSVRVVVVK